MSNIPISSLPLAIALDGTEQIPLVQGGTTKRSTASAIAGTVGSQLAGAIEFLIDGSTSVITTGSKGYLTVPFNCTVTKAVLLGDIVGSIVVDVWKCTYAQFDAGATHPVIGDSITAGTPPTITAATKSVDAALASWVVTLLEDDILGFTVLSCTSIKRVTLSLSLDRVLT
jgi:hypothetical protein